MKRFSENTSPELAEYTKAAIIREKYPTVLSNWDIQDILDQWPISDRPEMYQFAAGNKSDGTCNDSELQLFLLYNSQTSLATFSKEHTMMCGMFICTLFFNIIQCIESDNKEMIRNIAQNFIKNCDIHLHPEIKDGIKRRIEIRKKAYGIIEENLNTFGGQMAQWLIQYIDN